MNLSPTYGNFVLRGTVLGLADKKAFTEGQTENGKWKRVQFGIKVSENSIVYVELFGSKTSKVKLFKSGTGEPLTVEWDDLYNSEYSNYRYANQVKLNISHGSICDDISVIAWDAIESFEEQLKDGLEVLVKGSLQINEYKGNSQEQFVIRELYALEGFTYENKQPEAFFSQEIVYVDANPSSINGEYLLDTRIIIRNSNDYDIIPFNFYIYNKEVYEYFKNNVTIGSTLRVHGNILNYVPLITIEGRRVINGSVVKGLEVTGGNVASINLNNYDVNKLDKVNISGSPFEEDTNINEWGF
ncbi:hypothetical protein HFE03_07595 [Paenibacillus sp. EKM102P]|uniref:hypothetical protein n=1 Tax=unclassified Paenibacillus TaxID=185978 RepID=UPI00142DAAF5|nr:MULTISPECIES: hypothetical protein [unclassified Paenibacillus]KAF6620508.1 hypothetical protein HFE00_05500 [Paenibacillus sp. EKM101P]KAF6623500.1 hypothetical protein HFE03_07595 [Paenibacillus sp. EKM102P]KAF6633936.1 hypothetical protein HFE01_06910 [Paenibacillus sp. EKM10P]KAF6649464.1 hypothetical protein HFE02_01875 [Paenibacillus sp. EKM11P]